MNGKAAEGRLEVTRSSLQVAAGRGPAGAWYHVRWPPHWSWCRRALMQPFIMTRPPCGIAAELRAFGEPMGRRAPAACGAASTSASIDRAGAVVVQAGFCIRPIVCRCRSTTQPIWRRSRAWQLAAGLRVAVARVEHGLQLRSAGDVAPLRKHGRDDGALSATISWEWSRFRVDQDSNGRRRRCPFQHDVVDRQVHGVLETASAFRRSSRRASRTLTFSCTTDIAAGVLAPLAWRAADGRRLRRLGFSLSASARGIDDLLLDSTRLMGSSRRRSGRSSLPRWRHTGWRWYAPRRRTRFRGRRGPRSRCARG